MTKWSSWKSTLLPFALWKTLGFALLGWGIWSSYELVDRDLERESSALSSYVDNQAWRQIAAIESFGAAISVSGYQNREFIEQTGHRIIAQNPAIYMIELAPEVPDQQVEAFIEQQRKEGNPGFTLRGYEYESAQRWKPINRTGYHYPVTMLIPPRPAAQEVLGLDLASTDLIAPTLSKAVRRGRPTASPPLKILEGNTAYALVSVVHDDAGAQLVLLFIVRASDLLPESLPKDIGIEIAPREPSWIPASRAHLVRKSASDVSSKEITTMVEERNTNVPGFDFKLKLTRPFTWSDLISTPMRLSVAAILITLIGTVVWGALRVRNYNRHETVERELRQQAQIDPLTGLPNRTLLKDRIDHARAMSRREGRRMAVLFIDLDGFKAVNDRLGHEVGDELLTAVADRLARHARDGDTVSRYGGDEFVVVLEAIANPDDAEIVASKMRDHLCEPFHVAGEIISIAASIGIATYPVDGDDAVQLLRAADSAMYAQKRRSRVRLHSSNRA